VIPRRVRRHNGYVTLAIEVVYTGRLAAISGQRVNVMTDGNYLIL